MQGPGYLLLFLQRICKVHNQQTGGTIVVAGHSNTIPLMINYLTGHKDEYKTFEDSDYGNLIIVTVTHIGKEANVIWLRY